jgi:hypothetical protein
MANKKTQTAHYFDAVGSFTLPCTICAIHWSGSTSAGDDISISEHSGTAGNIIFAQKSDAQKGTPPVCGIGLSVDGFRVDTLDAGYVIVYTE